jgi:hypothetical protein
MVLPQADGGRDDEKETDGNEDELGDWSCQFGFIRSCTCAPYSLSSPMP